MLSNNYREYLMASTEDDDSKINDPDESVHSESENIDDSEKELSDIEILQKKHHENYFNYKAKRGGRKNNNGNQSCLGAISAREKNFSD